MREPEGPAAYELGQLENRNEIASATKTTIAQTLFTGNPRLDALSGNSLSLFSIRYFGHARRTAESVLVLMEQRRVGSCKSALVSYLRVNNKARVRPLRIVLIGQAAFGEKVLTELHARGEEIVCVFTPPDKPGGKIDPLKAKAIELKIPVSQPKSFKTDEVYEHFKSLDADLAILAYVTVIVPERILYLPKHKSICFHPSLLPRHRGGSAVNWAIIQGDTETGVTVFWPDQGIDTGPILLQKRAPIYETDTAGSLYFERLFPLGIEAIIESVELIKAGRAPAIPQDESLATYEPLCRDEHARIDFSRPAQQVYNLVRGCDPQPGAWAEMNGKRVRLYGPSLEKDAPSEAPGTVLSVDADGMRLALSGAILKVTRLRIEPNQQKLAPQELVARGELAVGDRLT